MVNRFTFRHPRAAAIVLVLCTLIWMALAWWLWVEIVQAVTACA